jgi:hypothetical protein
VDDLLDDGADDFGPAGRVAAIGRVWTLFHLTTAFLSAEGR